MADQKCAMNERLNKKTSKVPTVTGKSAVEQLAPAQTIQRLSAVPNQILPSDIMQLQRTVGNRTVGAWLERSQSSKSIIQTKLTVNAPGDRYEQEADRVAEQVMRMQMVQDEKLKTEEKPAITTLPEVQLDSTDTFEVDENFERQLIASKGQGQPLPSALRENFGSKFGADFNGVRIHTDAQSDVLNRSIQAIAFTAGQDVFFRQGEYQPRNPIGQKLIAHELTHVMQQSAKLTRGSSPLIMSIQRGKKDQKKTSKVTPQFPPRRLKGDKSNWTVREIYDQKNKIITDPKLILSKTLPDEGKNLIAIVRPPHLSNNKISIRMFDFGGKKIFEGNEEILAEKPEKPTKLINLLEKNNENENEIIKSVRNIVMPVSKTEDGILEVGETIPSHRKNLIAIARSSHISDNKISIRVFDSEGNYSDVDKKNFAKKPEELTKLLTLLKEKNENENEIIRSVRSIVMPVSKTEGGKLEKAKQRENNDKRLARDWENGALHHIISKEVLAGIIDEFDLIKRYNTDNDEGAKRFWRIACEVAGETIEDQAQGNPYKLLWNLPVNLEIGPEVTFLNPGIGLDPNTNPGNDASTEVGTKSGRVLDPISEKLQKIENLYFAYRNKEGEEKYQVFGMMADALVEVYQQHGKQNSLPSPKTEQWIYDPATFRYLRKGVRKWPGAAAGKELFFNERKQKGELSKETFECEGESSKDDTTLRLKITADAIKHICERHTFRHFDFDIKGINYFWGVKTDYLDIKEMLTKNILNQLAKVCLDELQRKSKEIADDKNQKIKLGGVKISSIDSVFVYAKIDNIDKENDKHIINCHIKTLVADGNTAIAFTAAELKEIQKELNIKPKEKPPSPQDNEISTIHPEIIDLKDFKIEKKQFEPFENFKKNKLSHVPSFLAEILKSNESAYFPTSDNISIKINDKNFEVSRKNGKFMIKRMA